MQELRVATPVRVDRTGKETVVRLLVVLRVNAPLSVVSNGRLRVVVPVPPVKDSPPAVTRAGRL